MESITEQLLIITIGTIITLILGSIAWYLRLMAQRTEQIPLLNERIDSIDKSLSKICNRIDNIEKEVWSEISNLRKDIKDYLQSQIYEQRK